MKYDRAYVQEGAPKTGGRIVPKSEPSSLKRANAEPVANCDEPVGWWANAISRIKNCDAFLLSPWMYWMVGLVFIQQEGFSGDKTDPALVPSIFSPESAPAHAISHLAGFV